MKNYDNINVGNVDNDFLGFLSGVTFLYLSEKQVNLHLVKNFRLCKELELY
jgi:hypothetical protein